MNKIRVACFGGGTGMPALLSGLKNNPWIDITAVVSMFDSGGSSGVLRDQFGILPPGDIMKCFVALSETELAARRILLKRMEHPTIPSRGHSGGNLLLFALEQVYGNYRQAIDTLGRLLSIKGRVAPVSFDHSTLCADYEDGTSDRGEALIERATEEGKTIKRIYLDPPAKASEEAITAIREADVICIGPGGFYKSILPNFLPLGIKEALSATNKPVIFIGNLLTEGSGMKDYTIETMLDICSTYIGRAIDYAVLNVELPEPATLARYAKESKYPLIRGGRGNTKTRMIEAELWTNGAIARHDSARLAYLLAMTMHQLASQ